MYRVRWDRILVFVILLSIPLGLHWLGDNVQVGDFGTVQIIGEACATNQDIKCLLLLAVLLASVYLFIRTLLRG